MRIQQYDTLRDLDLLVCPKDINRAIALLVSLGYDVQDRFVSKLTDSIDSVWRYQYHVHLWGDGVALEIHWRTSRNDRMMPSTLDELFERVQFVQLGGFAIPTLSDSDLLEYLALHGASHCWNRLKWLVDFKHLLALRRGRGVEEAKGVSVKTGLRLCTTFWSTPEGGRCIQDWKTKFCVAQLVDSDEDPSGLLNMSRRSFLLLSLHSGIAAKFQYVLTLLVWPPVYEIIRLPRWLTFLYPVFGIMAWGMNKLRLIRR